MERMPKLGERVRVHGQAATAGRVVGFATVLLHKYVPELAPTLLAVVELDQGVPLAPGVSLFRMEAHPDNLEYTD